MKHFWTIAIRCRLGLASLAVVSFMAAGPFLGMSAVSAQETAAVSPRSAPLRVLTWNVWALPAVSSNLEARVELMGAAIGALDPDAALLQEVWDEDYATVITTKLSEMGLAYSHHFYGPDGGNTGLLIVSRYPLSDLNFAPFRLGETPHTPWHLDWMSQKGIASAVLESPIGPVRILNTHLHAQYETDSYESTRLLQALELADVANTHAALPVVVGGDLNTRAGALPRRALLARGELTDAAPNFGVDSVLYRMPGGQGMELVSVRRVLHEPVDLGNGVWAPLSDHDGVLVDLVVSRGDSKASPMRGLRAAWTDLKGEVAEVLTIALASTRTKMWLARMGAIFCLIFGGFLMYRLRRSNKRLRKIALGGVFAFLVLWLGYVGMVYGPTQVAGLEERIEQETS